MVARGGGGRGAEEVRPIRRPSMGQREGRARVSRGPGTAACARSAGGPVSDRSAMSGTRPIRGSPTERRRVQMTRTHHRREPEGAFASSGGRFGPFLRLGWVMDPSDRGSALSAGRSRCVSAIWVFPYGFESHELTVLGRGRCVRVIWGRGAVLTLGWAADPPDRGEAPESGLNRCVRAIRRDRSGVWDPGAGSGLAGERTGERPRGPPGQMRIAVQGASGVVS